MEKRRNGETKKLRNEGPSGPLPEREKMRNKFVRTKMRPKEGTKIKLQREIFRFGQIC